MTDKATAIMSHGAKGKRKGLESHSPFQGHAPDDPRPSHEAPHPRGSTTSQEHSLGDHIGPVGDIQPPDHHTALTAQANSEVTQKHQLQLLCASEKSKPCNKIF